MKQNSKGEVNLFIVLITIIIIASIILALKITGVIKTEPTKVVEEDYNYTNLEYEYGDEYKSDYKTDNNESFLTVINTMRNMSIVVVIFVYLIGIGLNIGICMLYAKLGIPSYIVKFNFIWPILSVVSNFLPGGLRTIVSLISLIMGIAGLYYYFKAVGMSGWWAILPFASAILVLLAVLSSGLMILAIIVVLSSIIAYVISNIRLARIFRKGTLFTVGLAILPFIFQPILGFQRNETI